MKKFLGTVVLLTILMSVFFVPGLAKSPKEYSFQEFGELDVSDQYLVLFKGKGIPSGFKKKVEKLGGSVVFSHDVGIAVVGGFTEETASELGRDKDILNMQQDNLFKLNPTFNENILAAVDSAPQTPVDPTTAYFYPRQWNMRAIDADEAWAAGRIGSSGITIAILDTGIDYLYPDLVDRVDLSRSISFMPDDDDLVSFFFPSRHPVTDLMFHGTHVASTAVSNSYVVAGVTTQTTLMGVKVCNVFGECPDSSIIAGVLHAVDNGADVINLSLGGYFNKAEEKGLVGFFNKVFNYAKKAGVTVVVSAGNDAIDLDHDGNTYAVFCSTPNVLCISATGPASAAGVDGPWEDVDSLAPYSNIGRSAITVAAPGGTEIPSNGGWVWAACSQTSLWFPICGTGTYVLGVIGTSMSAPHVSGLASLIIEDVGRNPGLVRARIQQSADDLGQRGTDPFYGKGRINVAEAVLP